MNAGLQARAEALFNKYNETGPNPWKTFDGRDVPRWPEVGEQVKAKWEAVAAAEIDAIADDHAAHAEGWEALKSERDGYKRDAETAKAEVADLNAELQSARKFGDETKATVDALRVDLARVRTDTALRFDRGEAATVQTALTTGRQLATEIREFLGHFSGDKRAALQKMIDTMTAGPVAALAQKVTGTLGAYDLAGCVPPGAQ